MKGVNCQTPENPKPGDSVRGDTAGIAAPTNGSDAPPNGSEAPQNGSPLRNLLKIVLEVRDDAIAVIRSLCAIEQGLLQTTSEFLRGIVAVMP